MPAICVQSLKIITTLVALSSARKHHASQFSNDLLRFPVAATEVFDASPTDIETSRHGGSQNATAYCDFADVYTVNGPGSRPALYVCVQVYSYPSYYCTWYLTLVGLNTSQTHSRTPALLRVTANMRLFMRLFEQRWFDHQPARVSVENRQNKIDSRSRPGLDSRAKK